MSFKDEPIKFITFERKSPKDRPVVCITKEAENLLESLSDDISIICIAGPMRTGKSYLLNRFKGTQKGFATGRTVNPETQGIWLWGKPFDYKGKKVLLMDTEGLGDTKKSKDYDIIVFSLSILLSSVFMYNNLGAINASALTDLKLVVDLTKHIRLRDGPDDSKEEDFVEFFPDFYWVARDFMLRLPPGGANEYLEDNLKLEKYPPETDYDKIKYSLRNCFKKRGCFCLTRPCDDDDQLNDVENVPYDELRPKFKDVTQEMVIKVLDSASIMQLKNPIDKENVVRINGRGMLQLAKTYVAAINSGKIPSIPDAYLAMCQRESSIAVDEATHEYDQMMDLTVQKYPMEAEDLMKEHEKAIKKAQDRFKSTAKGDKHMFEKYSNILLNNLDKREKKVGPNNTVEQEVVGGRLQYYYEKNRLKSKECCEKLMKDEVAKLEEMNKTCQNIDAFKSFTQEAFTRYDRGARGPYKFFARETLVSESARLSRELALKLKLTDEQKKNMENTIKLNQVAAKNDELRKQVIEREAQFNAFQKQTAQQMEDIRVKTAQDMTEMKQKHEVDMEKRRIEHERFVKEQLHEAAEKHQQDMQARSAEHEQTLLLLKTQMDTMNNNHQQTMTNMNQQLEQQRVAIADANRRAEEANARAAQNSGGGGGGCTIL